MRLQKGVQCGHVNQHAAIMASKPCNMWNRQYLIRVYF